METIKVVCAGIDLESWIVQFGTFAVGSSEQPSKVLIYFLESKGCLAWSGKPMLKSMSSADIVTREILRQTNSTKGANNRHSLMQSGIG